MYVHASLPCPPLSFCRADFVPWQLSSCGTRCAGGVESCFESYSLVYVCCAGGRVPELCRDLALHLWEVHCKHLLLHKDRMTGPPYVINHPTGGDFEVNKNKKKDTRVLVLHTVFQIFEQIKLEDVLLYLNVVYSSCVLLNGCELVFSLFSASRPFPRFVLQACACVYVCVLGSGVGTLGCA